MVESNLLCNSMMQKLCIEDIQIVVVACACGKMWPIIADVAERKPLNSDED